MAFYQLAYPLYIFAIADQEKLYVAIPFSNLSKYFYEKRVIFLVCEPSHMTYDKSILCIAQTHPNLPTLLLIEKIPFFVNAVVKDNGTFRMFRCEFPVCCQPGASTVYGYVTFHNQGGQKDKSFMFYAICLAPAV